MKIFSSIVLLLLLALLSVNAQTQRWIYYGEDVKDIKYYYDANIRSAPTGIITTWTKSVYANDSEALFLFEFDCKQEKSRMLKAAKYSAAGNLEGSKNEAGKWEIPIPDSIGEGLIRTVCKTWNTGSQATTNSNEKNNTDTVSREIPNPLYNAKENQNYTTKKNQVVDRDTGVDVARVSVKKANLRASADVKSDIILELPQGNLLVLLAKESSGGWYNVIDVETSQEGWIHGNNIEVQFTNERQISKPTLARTATERSDANPYVIIKNDSENTLYLKLGANRYVIEPNYSKRVDLISGSYKFYATSPKVLPDIGEISFERGAYYTWRFYTQKVLKP